MDLRSNIKIYPQPARNVVTIEADKLISSLTISDISGRILLKNDFAQQVKQHVIDISFLNEGIYFMSILIDDKIITKKMKLIK